MCKLGFEHVEPHVARHRAVALAGDELEARFGVDEPLDEPGAGHAVDMDTLARDPGSATRPFPGRPRFGKGPFLALRGSQPRFEIAEKPVDSATAGCGQEIDRRDLRGSPLEPRKLGIGPRSFLTADPRTRSNFFEKTPGRLCDLGVIDVSSGVEHRHNLLIGEAIHESRLADRGLSVAFHNLARDPLKVLLGLLAPGQDVNRVLDGRSAESLESAPDLDTEIVRLRRDLVDEKEPARFRVFAHGSSLKHLKPSTGTDVSTTRADVLGCVHDRDDCVSSTLPVTVVQIRILLVYVDHGLMDVLVGVWFDIRASGLARMLMMLVVDVPARVRDPLVVVVVVVPFSQVQPHVDGHQGPGADERRADRLPQDHEGDRRPEEGHQREIGARNAISFKCGEKSGPGRRAPIGGRGRPGRGSARHGAPIDDRVEAAGSAE